MFKQLRGNERSAATAESTTALLRSVYWLVCDDPVTSRTSLLPLSNFTFFPAELITEPLAEFVVSESSCRFFRPITPVELLLSAPAAETVLPAVRPTVLVVAPAVEFTVE